MSECKHRRKDGVCMKDLEYVYKGFCVEAPCTEFEPQTNADSIRAMTDEEIAEWNADFYCPQSRWENGGECPRRQERNENKCYECWLDWLKQEATDA